MNEQLAIEANPSVTPTPEEIHARITAFREQQFTAAADHTRREKAKRLGLIDPSKELTIEELRASVPLEGDTMKYVRLAVDAHGFASFPKAHGRRKPRMTKHQQHLKSRYLEISKDLFKIEAGRLVIEATKNGTTFVGVPEETMRKIAAKATRLAAIDVIKSNSAARRIKNRQREVNRKINAGIINPVNQRNYVHADGAYGA